MEDEVLLKRMTLIHPDPSPAVAHEAQRPGVQVCTGHPSKAASGANNNGGVQGVGRPRCLVHPSGKGFNMAPVTPPSRHTAKDSGRGGHVTQCVDAVLLDHLHSFPNKQITDCNSVHGVVW